MQPSLAIRYNNISFHEVALVEHTLCKYSGQLLTVCLLALVGRSQRPGLCTKEGTLFLCTHKTPPK